MSPGARAKGDPLLVLSTTATMLEDPSAVSPSVHPMSRAVIWATGGAGRAATSGAATVVSGRGPPIMATTTSAYVGGALSGYVAPAEVHRRFFSDLQGRPPSPRIRLSHRGHRHHRG